jgi:hypothetical protein
MDLFPVMEKIQKTKKNSFLMIYLKNFKLYLMYRLRKLKIENYLKHVLSFTQPPRRKLMRRNVIYYIYQKKAFGSRRTIIRLKINNIILISKIKY